MLRIGIDNGKQGAIVALDQHHDVVFARPMPMVESELDDLQLLRVLRELAAHDAYAVQEYGQVMGRMAARTAFRYGGHCRAISMALAAAGIPFQVVKPQVWQRQLGVSLPPGGSKEARRKKIKSRVVQAIQRQLPRLDLTPGQLRKPHDGLADAAAMALYAAHVRPFMEVV